MKYKCGLLHRITYNTYNIIDIPTTTYLLGDIILIYLLCLCLISGGIQFLITSLKIFFTFVLTIEIEGSVFYLLLAANRTEKILTVIKI